MYRATWLWAALFLGVVGRAEAGPTTLDLGTDGNAKNWLITGAGAKGSAADQVDVENAGEISLTKDGEMDGKFVKDGSLAKFNGFWVANETFTLPSNATNVSLKFSGLFADDRVVLELNGHIIGNATFNGNPGSGVMSFPGTGDTTLPSPPSTVFMFTNKTDGTVKSRSDFVIGGVNELSLIVNNTDHENLTDPTVTFQNPDDATEAGLVATLTYGVPEPGSLTLAGVGLGGFGLSAWRRWRKRWIELA